MTEKSTQTSPTNPMADFPDPLFLSRQKRLINRWEFSLRETTGGNFKRKKQLGNEKNPAWKNIGLRTNSLGNWIAADFRGFKLMIN